MKIYQLNEAEQAFYEDVLQRNAKNINKKKGVTGVGVGYKISGNKLTDTVSITAVVSKKDSDVSDRNRVPDEFNGVPTDVVQVDEIYPQLLGNLESERFKRFKTVRGGILIHNRNLCWVNQTALGCVVYDEATGDPLGLTAQHGIAYVHYSSKYIDEYTDCPCPHCTELRLQKKTRGYLRTAEIGDPINQPNSFNTKDDIGKLFKRSETLDLALIKLDARDCEPIIEGISGEVNDPIPARIGMPVECSAFKTHSRGVVIYRGDSIYYPGRTILKIQIDSQYVTTRGGDSGGLWLERGTRRPVGIHTAKVRGQRVAVATCISHLKEFHPVTFQPPKFREMVKSLKPFHTAIAKSNNNEFFAFCNRVGDVSRPDPLQVVKFGKDYKRAPNAKWHEIRPVASGVAATSFKNNIYCAWRSASANQIQTARLTKDLTFDIIAPYPRRTRYKPAICGFKTHLSLVYTDLESETVDIAFVGSGGKTYPFDLESTKACSAPAISLFGDHAIVAWVDQSSKQIFMKKVLVSGNWVYFMNYPRISRTYLPVGDPTLVSGWESDSTGRAVEWLYLGFTTQGGGLQILRRTHGNNRWSPVPNTATPSNFSPTLFHHNGRVIWTRQSQDGLG